MKHKKVLFIAALVVIALVLILPLFFAMKSRAIPPASQSLPPSVIPPQASASEESAPIQPQRPSACAFPLAQTQATESTPETYTFSVPETVYTFAATEANVEIVEWLPDNQQVLLVQNIRSSNQQTIKLFDPETGQTQVYAQREWTEQHPSWNDELKAVVYPVRYVLRIVDNIPQLTRQAWISYGDPQSAQMLDENLSQFYVAVKPDGKEIAYLKDKRIVKRDGSLREIPPKSFDLDLWNYRRMQSGIFPLMYRMAWRPGTSQIFLYTFADKGQGYTFLLDVDTGDICELDLGGWSVAARWSPNGRYLAIESSQATGRPVGPTVLTVLDTGTGALYTSEVVPGDLPGIHAIQDFAWAPDNHHLLVLGSTLPFPHCAPNCQTDKRLYLVDWLSGQVDPVLPEYQFAASLDGINLAWSPDGSKVIALCPEICMIPVQRSGKWQVTP